MNLIKFYSTIKTSFPSNARELFKKEIKEEEELLSILVSFEINNPYTFNTSITTTKNSDKYTILEALARVCYWLNIAEYKYAKSEFHKLPTEQQQILSEVFSGTLQRRLGRDFLLDTIPRLYEIKELYASFIKLPLSLEADLINNLEGIKREFALDTYKLPAAIFNVPKVSRKSSRLFYLVKNGNTIHSNLSNKIVRDYFKENFHFYNFGCIFYFSKKDNRRYGKQLTPVCISDFKTILKLYKGNKEVSFTSLDFDMKKYFVGVITDYIEIKFGQYTIIEDNDKFLSNISKVSENNLVVFSNGVQKIRFNTKTRTEKVSDFILDEEFIPIGIILRSTEQFYLNISESFINGGLENRYITVVDTYFGQELLKSNVYDLQGKGMFECNCCGAVTKSNLKGLCHRCYKEFKDIAEYSIVPELVLDRSIKNEFSILLEKYKVDGKEGQVTFTRDLGLVKGKQLSLPFMNNV